MSTRGSLLSVVPYSGPRDTMRCSRTRQYLVCVIIMACYVIVTTPNYPNKISETFGPRFLGIDLSRDMLAIKPIEAHFGIDCLVLFETDSGQNELSFKWNWIQNVYKYIQHLHPHRLCSLLHENHIFIGGTNTVYPKKYAHGFALLCIVVVIHWLIFPYPSGLLHWHCGNLTIAPVPAKQPWWIWINTSCEFIMNDCITTTKQSTTKPCAYFLGYIV